jgi:ribosomal protein S6--L-glutamate ligase
VILSLHPIIEADRNVIIAGRDPRRQEIGWMRDAKAIILPQGVTRKVYGIAARSCPHVFPNYEVRFRYPGKIGFTRLCTELSLPHPATRIFERVGDARKSGIVREFPMVLKSDSGGEGQGVFLARDEEELRQVHRELEVMESGGWCGFVEQEFVENSGRDLRVVVMGSRTHAYWRKAADPHDFKHHLGSGGILDLEGDPDLRREGIALVERACELTGINLAGFDVLFRKDNGKPLLLEVNYFFGRRGLGGSESFYDLLKHAVDEWLFGLFGASHQPTPERLIGIREGESG